jgi:hypothetical protein
VKLRRPLLPDDARAALPLGRGERAVAAARLADGGWLVATGTALLTVAGRTPWADVAHAQWFDEEQLLVVDPVPGAGGSLRFRLAEPGRVPETVHERVMASIALSRRVALPGGGARLVARHGDGPDLVWQVVPDPGTDLSAPGVQAAVDEALAGLRSELA